MDAKHVWRAALGELQVSLSPANFETWLRDTQLIDVEDNRFRIAVPNGFAKDWPETRYRSLISQTLARVVGYSVQVEFVVATGGVAAAQAAEVAAQPVRLGSRVRVTNLANGRSIVVRVNDRGPFKKNRIIDLSYVAAAKLDMIREGTAMVEVVAVGPASSGAASPPAASARHFYAQAGAFAEEANAAGSPTGSTPPASRA